MSGVATFTVALDIETWIVIRHEDGERSRVIAYCADSDDADEIAEAMDWHQLRLAGQGKLSRPEPPPYNPDPDIIGHRD